MEAKTLKKCIEEAQRFIDLAEAVPLRTIDVETKLTKYPATYIEAGKASGAMKRASMDLSRELANIRQGR